MVLSTNLELCAIIPGKPSLFSHLSPTLHTSSYACFSTETTKPPDPESIILSVPHILVIILSHHFLASTESWQSSLTSPSYPLHLGWCPISTEIAIVEVTHYFLFSMSTGNFPVLTSGDPWVMFGAVNPSILIISLAPNWKPLLCFSPSSWEKSFSVCFTDALIFVYSLNTGVQVGCLDLFTLFRLLLCSLVHSYAWNCSLHVAGSQSCIYAPNCSPSDPSISSAAWLLFSDTQMPPI